jgi:hypothetical protein
VRNDGPPCDCAKIQAEAIESHTACYTSTPSFCSLSEADIRVVARIVDIGDLAQLGRPGLRESGRTLYVCFRQTGLDKGFQLAVSFGSETIKEFGESARDNLLIMLDIGEKYALDDAKSDIAEKFKQLKEMFRRKIP